MKLSAFSLLTALYIAAAFVSCNKDEKGDVAVAQLDLKKVSYGKDTAQNMDIYLPEGRDSLNTKVLLFIHGGSWSSGDKTDFLEAIDSIRYKLKDYAIFNINYRLAYSGLNRYPTQVDDISNALNFIQTKSSEYKINPNKIGVIGASAGAHLALLYAYKNNSDGKIKAVVDLFGPSDLTDLYRNHPIPEASRVILANFLGTTPTLNPVLYQQASPINYISAQSVPTRIFHGSLDIVVPISQSQKLKSKLEASNVKVEMTVYQGEGHGWYGANLSDTYSKAAEFIKENVE